MQERNWLELFLKPPIIDMIMYSSDEIQIQQLISMLQTANGALQESNVILMNRKYELEQRCIELENRIRELEDENNMLKK